MPLGAEKEEDIINVVQPDISVICDAKKLDKKGCIGAPDLIIEILSPGNPRRDKMEKFNLYETPGVKEYWIVSPEGRMVEVFVLGPNGTYGRPQVYAETDTVEISVLKGITIDLGDVLIDPGSMEQLPERQCLISPYKTINKRDERRVRWNCSD